MSYHCFKCNTTLSEVEHGKVGRSSSCSSCGNDLRVCKNCKHYDRSAYNECSEPQADRVLEKERGNFCDYFSFREGPAIQNRNTSVDALKSLEDLFKK